MQSITALPAALSSIGGRPNATSTGAPAARDRSSTMRARTASSLSKRVALNELR